LSGAPDSLVDFHTGRIRRLGHALLLGDGRGALGLGVRLALLLGREPVWKSNLTAQPRRDDGAARPPRHRRDASSMAWHGRFLAARPSQDGRVIAEK